MKRSLKLRAKTIKNQWVFDNVKVDNSLYKPFKDFNIDIKTLGQYIGYKDKNNKPVYEGDIVKHERYNRLFAVEWIEEYACFAFIDKEDFDTPSYFNMNDVKDKCVVISNIYDNSMFDEYYRKRNK